MVFSVGLCASPITTISDMGRPQRCRHDAEITRIFIAESAGLVSVSRFYWRAAAMIFIAIVARGQPVLCRNGVDFRHAYVSAASRAGCLDSAIISLPTKYRQAIMPPPRPARRPFTMMPGAGVRCRVGKSNLSAIGAISWRVSISNAAPKQLAVDKLRLA